MKRKLLESLRRIRWLIRKEFIQIVRNRQNFAMLLVAPVIQLVIFGSASRLDVQNVSTVIVDLDRSPMSREVAEAFSRSGYFKIVAHLNSYDSVDSLLERNQATMAILIPPDFEQRIQGRRKAEVGILVDGVDTVTAGTVSGYAQAILLRFSNDIMASRINSMQGLLYDSTSPRLIVPGFTDASRAWFNPNLNSKDFFVPGVVVLILLALSIVLTSAVIVREREIGTIEQLMVAPISRLELILGKTIPCFLIEIVTLLIVTPLALLIYDVPLRGSLWFFFGSFLLFLITASAIGMTISAFCSTQQQAVLTSFMFLQPSILLSGYAFPIENMPWVIQYVTYLNPVRYFITIVRGVFLKGSGWDVLWPQLLPIFVMAVVYIACASALFKRRID
ncbi:MAG: ABC transporter permease [Deltaproteobacteria bacterium]|nr:ABC transporter permease [Deltaproteobacteria bacterium]